MPPQVVLSADIRKSTFLMKEAEDPQEYADTMTDFITAAHRIVVEHREGGRAVRR